MKMKFGKEFIIGVSVIIAIAVLIVGIDYLKGINIFKPTNFYEVYYDNVNGLEKSAPVLLNGYKVGQVREVSIDYAKPGKIKVVLALNNSLRLPQGTSAQLGQTLLSGAFINLISGKGPGEIEKGSTLPAVIEPDLMESVQKHLMPSIAGILPKVDSLLTNLNRLAGDPALTQSIERLDGITANVEDATRSLNGTMDAVGAQVPAIIRNAGKASVKLDTITENLSRLSSDLRNLPLQPTMENVERITTNLEAFSRQLNDRNSTLGMLTNDPQLYHQLNRVTADIDSLILDIKKNPKRYISIKLL